MRFRLRYVQPQRATYDTRIPIYEVKEHRFEADDKVVAEKVADEFLKEGGVLCGYELQPRQRVELEMILPLPPLLEPKPEFLPIHEV